jgi:hypothetical protein
VNTLCLPAVAPQLLAAARAYQAREIWYARLFLLMPDHWHALLAFPPERTMRTVVTQWKSYTAKTLAADGVRWQRDFFDHRLRCDESLDAKASYIRANPVRAGSGLGCMRWETPTPGPLDRASNAGTGMGPPTMDHGRKKLSCARRPAVRDFCSPPTAHCEKFSVFA